MFTSNYNRWFYWLLGATALLLFFRIGYAPIYILDEAKNAQCAREMLDSGNWIVPTFNGELRTDKPVLHYWFMMLSYKIWGVNAGAARFFSGLLGLASIAIIYWLVKKWKDAGTAFFTALVLAVSTHFLFEFRLSVPDPYLIFFNTAGLCFGFCFLQEKKWKWILLAAIALALATLAKGPVALVLPGLAFIIYIIINGRWADLLDIKIVVAILVYLLVALPWYLAVHKATNGLWTSGFFLEHNLNRFSSEMEGHGGIFIITPVIVFVGLLPFSILIFSAFNRKFSERRHALVVFSAVVSLLYIVFFSISSTKLPNYPMPCYPFVAILIGRILYLIVQKRLSLPAYAKISLLVLTTGIAIAGYFGIRAEEAVKNYAWLSFPLLLLPVILSLAFFVKSNQTQNRWLSMMIAGYYFFNLYFLAIAYPLLYRQNPVTKMVPLIDQPSSLICSYQVYNPAFNFNLTKTAFTIPVFENSEALEVFCENNTRPGQNIFVLTRVDRAAELDSNQFVKQAVARDLFERPTTLLLKWNP